MTLPFPGLEILGFCPPSPFVQVTWFSSPSVVIVPTASTVILFPLPFHCRVFLTRPFETASSRSVDRSSPDVR